MDGVKRLDIYAPVIAKIAKPGQFVSVCLEPDDERVPMSISDCLLSQGAISLIVQDVGITSHKLCELSINDSIFSIIGPL